MKLVICEKPSVGAAVAAALDISVFFLFYAKCGGDTLCHARLFCND